MSWSERTVIGGTMAQSRSDGRRFSDQLAGILAQLAAGVTVGLNDASAAACAAVLGVSGIGVRAAAGSAHGTDGGGEPVWRAGSMEALLADTELTLGEGPGIDAAAGATVLADDLTTELRWPMFAPAACELGVQAVFAFPLRIGAIHVGVLLAYRTSIGPLLPQQLVDARVLGDALTLRLLDPRDANPTALGDSLGSGRMRVHQATGMVSVQLGVSLAEALTRLRGYAFAAGRPLDAVATDVVAGTLRLGERP
jgi:hypothetical protein